MAAGILDDDELSTGLRADGIVVLISSAATGVGGWIASTVVPNLGTSYIAGFGMMTGASVYLFYARMRRKKLVQQKEENENIRKQMANNYSAMISKSNDSEVNDLWNEIRFEIATSELSETNQRILERELIHSHSLSQSNQKEELHINNPNRNSIVGDGNTMISSEGSTILATGDGAVTSQGNIVIHQGVDSKDHAIALAQIQLLEEKLALMSQESNEVKAKNIALETSKLAEKMQNNSHIEFSAQKLIELAQASITAGRLDLAEGQVNQSLRFLNPQADKYWISKSLNLLGLIYNGRGLTPEAESYYKESLLIANEISNLERKSSAMNGLANLLSNKGEYLEAESMHLANIDCLKEIGDTARIAASLHNIGNIKYNMKKFDEADSYYNEALTINRKLGNEYRKALNLQQLGAVEVMRENYVVAENLLNESIAISTEGNYRARISSAIYVKGILYFEQGKIDDAEQSLSESLLLSRETGSKYIEAKSLIKLAKVAKKQGNYKQAEKLKNEGLHISNELEFDIERINSLF